MTENETETAKLNNFFLSIAKYLEIHNALNKRFYLCKNHRPINKSCGLKSSKNYITIKAKRNSNSIFVFSHAEIFFFLKTKNKKFEYIRGNTGRTKSIKEKADIFSGFLLDNITGCI